MGLDHDEDSVLAVAKTVFLIPLSPDHINGHQNNESINQSWSARGLKKAIVAKAWKIAAIMTHPWRYGTTFAGITEKPSV